MPQETLARGATANLGEDIVKGNLTLLGVAASYDLAIGNNPIQSGNLAQGQTVTFAVNGSKVSVTNTTPGPGATNLTLKW